VRLLTSATRTHPPRISSLSSLCALSLQIRLCFPCLRRRLCSPSSSSMAPIRVLDPFAWPWSTADQLSLEALVLDEHLTPAGDGPNPAWMVPRASDKEPPRQVTSSTSSACQAWHQRPREQVYAGVVPPLRGGASQLRPNTISQVASFVAICEGFLGSR
jgi:hypothetical protein